MPRAASVALTCTLISTGALLPEGAVQSMFQAARRHRRVASTRYDRLRKSSRIAFLREIPTMEERYTVPGFNTTMSVQEELNAAHDPVIFSQLSPLERVNDRDMI